MGLPTTSGNRPSAVDAAVISTGLRRSSAPCITASFTGLPSSRMRYWQWVMRMMPLRVAMPNTATKPMSEEMLSTPSVQYTASTPPISASGRLTMTSNAAFAVPSAWYSSMKMMNTEARPSSMMMRWLRCWLSNWPPYCTK